MRRRRNEEKVGEEERGMVGLVMTYEWKEKNKKRKETKGECNKQETLNDE